MNEEELDPGQGHTPVVEARELVKIYRKGDLEIRPLDGLDLVVEPRELVALMGPSGSGKSTLLHVVGGLDKPDAGRCRVHGVDLAELAEGELCDFRAANIGFVFQSFNLLPQLTARENVELPLRLLSMGRERRREQVEAALALVGLSDRADHPPGQLSGGQEQRVAIARALAVDPEIIIADEPTGDLDEESSAQVVDILSRLARQHGKTILMVTHDRAVAACADRVLFFHHGRLWEDEEAAAQHLPGERQGRPQEVDA